MEKYIDRYGNLPPGDKAPDGSWKQVGVVYVVHCVQGMIFSLPVEQAHEKDQLTA